MQFEWDERKRRINLQKHGLDFRDVWKIFNAPLVIAPDERKDYGEERWTGIGVLQGQIVVIAFTERAEETIRVISLRKAMPHERANYYSTIGN
ncbi:MAG: BrnT family toxin [Caldilineaceae bacterium]